MLLQLINYKYFETRCGIMENLLRVECQAQGYGLLSTSAVSGDGKLKWNQTNRSWGRFRRALKRFFCHTRFGGFWSPWLRLLVLTNQIVWTDNGVNSKREAKKENKLFAIGFRGEKQASSDGWMRGRVAWKHVEWVNYETNKLTRERMFPTLKRWECGGAQKSLKA